MSVPIILLCNWLIPGGFSTGEATVVHTLTLLSFQFYALGGLFGFGVFAARQSMRARDVPYDGATQKQAHRQCAGTSNDTRHTVPARLAIETD
jgi:hypothetical protein